ncbi:MAG: glycosyltransferase family 4 protein [Patescibacteria group bacterium]|nr:glycosyltransferase family 4 protein [Patescibacteria group bacterium]MDE2218689.1 glycosyltransferase family 4 protein [Patescibacteria group bacterium]
MKTEIKKKILYCITKSNWGGAQRYVYDLTTGISREKYEVAVVLGGDGKLKEKLEATNVRVISVSALQRDVGIVKDFYSFFELLKIFRAEKPDIIHLNSSKMGGIGGLAGRIAGVKKIIFTAHGWAYNEDRNFTQKIAITILYFITVALSHLTIAVSEKAKEQFKSAGLMKKKIIIIHNGIGEIEFMEKEKARQEIEKKILPKSESFANRIKENTVWAGTISELHKNKGLTYAIEAVKKHPNLIFIIMGEGEERKNLEETIKKYELENSVFLIGNVENASSYLKAFDIFTLTSITEALPYAILEAGKAEVPIIASNVGGISEIINDMKSGILLQPRKPKEISDAIAYLIGHTEKKEDFSSLLKEKIDTEFSLAKMIDKTADLYR